MLKDFIILDVEATGIDPRLNEIIEFAAIRVKDFSIVDRFETLVKPKEKVSEVIEALTGISNQDLVNAPTWDEVKDKITEFIGDLPVGGHNVNFDFEYLSEHGLKLKNAHLDSWELATTVLPKLPAYSLNFLAFYLNLEAQPGHRAMADVLATWDLFKVLFSIAGKLSVKVQKELAKHLQKTEWVWKELFSGKIKIPDFDLPEATPMQSSAVDLGALESLAELPKKGKKVFVELSPEKNELLQALSLARDLSKDGPVFFLWPPIYPEPKSVVLDTAVLYPMSQYLSEEDFERFLGKENLSDLEAKLLVKTIIWQESGQEQNGLYLAREELYFWERWLGSIKGIKSKSYDKALAEVKKSRLVLIEPLALRELLEEKKIPKNATLVVSDPLAFEEESYRQERFMITAGFFEGFVSRRRELVERLPELSAADADRLFKILKNISSSLVFLLAQLGLMYEAFSTSGQTVEMMEHLWGSSEGSRTKLLAEKISEEIKLFNEKIAAFKLDGSFEVRRDEMLKRGEELISFLASLATSRDYTFWLKAYQGKVFLEALPEKGGRLLIEESEKQFKRLVIATSLGGKPLGKSYIEKLLGLFDETIEQEITAPKVTLTIPTGLVAASSPEYNDRLEKALEQILADKKRTIIIFPSRARLYSFMDSFKKKADDLGVRLALPETLGLLYQVNDFMKREGAVLALTLDYWFRLPKIAFDFNPYEDLTLERLIIVSLPFEVPDDPKLFAIGKRVGETANHFSEISMPRTAFRLRRIVYPALTNPGLRELFLLDARAREKDYGLLLVDALRGIPRANL